MPTLIQLPDNQHALLRDADEISNKQAKTLQTAGRKVANIAQKLDDLGLGDVRKALEADGADKDALNAQAAKIIAQLTDEEQDQLDIYHRTCTVVRLVEWSLEMNLPKTVEDVDDLPLRLYGPLTTEAAKIDLRESFGIDGATDPKADTDGLDN